MVLGRERAPIQSPAKPGSEDRRHLAVFLFARTLAAGVVLLLALLACNEVLPGQATKEAYDKQVKDSEKQAESFERSEIESPLVLASVSAGGALTCGLKQNGNTVCWGFGETLEGFSGPFDSISAGSTTSAVSRRTKQLNVPVAMATPNQPAHQQVPTRQ